MATLTFPLSRIEGHAQVVIEVHNGEVASAHFQATEFRGFQHFVRGVPAEEMVVIVPRICGVCSTAHHVAAVKALEDAFGVKPPPLAEMIRELLLLGQMIQNQATSLFLFTMPDRLGTDSLFQDAAGADEAHKAARITRHALEVRKAGTDLIKAAGGQFVHPVKAVVGGVTSGMDDETIAGVRQEILKALPLASELIEYYFQKSEELRGRVGTWGDNEPACFLAAVEDTLPDYSGGDLRVMGLDGRIAAEFAGRDYRSYLTHEETDYSYAGRTSFQGQVIQANSLARINMAEKLGTPLADKHLEDFRRAYGRPAYGIYLYDLARGIELVYSLERALEVLAWLPTGGDTQVAYDIRDGQGYGVVEAPRGPLIHYYDIKDGVIAEAEFVIPTVHNVRAMERALRIEGQRHINGGSIDLELENAVGRVVRAFDPCIACATH